MAIYSAAGRTTAVTAGGSLLELRAATGIRLLEMGVTNGAANAPIVGLGRPTNVPAGGTVTPGIAQDQGTTTSGIVLSGQSPAPAAPTVYLRRLALPATIGSGMVWSFYDAPIIVPAGQSLVLFLTAALASVALDVYVVFDD